MYFRLRILLNGKSSLWSTWLVTQHIGWKPWEMLEVSFVFGAFLFNFRFSAFIISFSPYFLVDRTPFLRLIMNWIILRMCALTWYWLVTPTSSIPLTGITELCIEGCLRSVVPDIHISCWLQNWKKVESWKLFIDRKPPECIHTHKLLLWPCLRSIVKDLGIPLNGEFTSLCWMRWSFEYGKTTDIQGLRILRLPFGINFNSITCGIVAATSRIIMQACSFNLVVDEQ